MADAKISALPSATLPLAGTEVLPIVQGGVTDKVTAADLLRQAGQTVTASNPILDLAQTWNNAAVDFTGWLLNVTNTTSGGGSLLLDLRLDDVTQLSMSKGGDLTVSNSATIGTIINTSLGAVGAPAYTFTGDLNTGIYGVSADVLGVTAGGVQVQSWGVGTSTLTGLLRPDADNTRDLATTANRWRSGYFGTNVVIGYSTTSAAQLHVGAGANGTLYDGAGNNITPQVINSQTSGSAAIGVHVNDGTNNRRAGLFVDQTNGYWGLTSRASSGVVPFIIHQNGAIQLQLSTSGVATLYNNLLFGTDATYDVGASGANRARDLYLSRNIVNGGTINAGGAISSGGSIAAGATNAFTWSGRSIVRSGADGQITLLNQAETGFTRLNFGGATVAEVSLKRNGAGLQVRKGDDSAMGSFEAAGADFYGNIRALTDASAITLGAATDVLLYRDAANILALRNGVNGQIFRVYNTTDGGANYERALIGWSGNILLIGTGSGGTGAQRQMDFITAGTSRWTLTNTGNLIAAADNTYDIGASGANRPRSVYTGGTIYSGNGYHLIGSGRVEWGGRSIIQSPADGVLALYNNALTGFTGIKLGGVTSAFPYIKVNGAEAQFRLADDSGFTKVQGQLKTHANAVAETPTATHTLTLYDAAGTAYRVLCCV